jgi:hypothetical protein
MIDKTKTVIEMVALMAEHEAAAATRSVNEADVVDALNIVYDLDIMGDFHLKPFLVEMANRYSLDKKRILSYIYAYEEC